MRRADKAADHAYRVALLRKFALEWVQRFKDPERGAKFFGRAFQAASQNGASPMKSIVAAFALLKRVQGERGEWAQLLELTDAIIDRMAPGEEKLFIAIQAGHIAFDKLDDIGRAKKYFAIAAAIEPKNPSVEEFVQAVGIDELPMAAGSMPSIPVEDAAAAERAAREADERAAADQAAARAAQEAAEREQRARAEREAEEAAERAAAEKAAADKAAADKVAADKAAADKAAADKVAADKAAADKAAADKAAADKAAADKAAADKAAADKAVPADLGAAMDRARNAETSGDRGVGEWKKVIAAYPTERAPRRELARVLRTAQSWAQLADALKDEEAKACASPEDKAEVFLELADAYAHLNNDNQVISSLTQAIHHDPSRMDAFDKLAAIYENKKRWPDLVKVLNEKAERTADGNAKIAIYLQVANLYLERFSNQAEAIKAFEKVLELDPNNLEAAEHLLAVYEKRRDWEKLIKLKEAEIERAPEVARAAKVIEVARMAATKVKKPDICTYWWEKVVQYEPTHEEALTELYKLYERNKDWEKLAEICQRQADAASDAKVRADALQRLGLLYTEKVENTAKAIEAWPRTPSRSSTSRKASGTTSRSSTARAARSTSTSACSSARSSRVAIPTGCRSR
jgi:tetratricopeptide (TPR) repeat protein